MPSSLSTQNRQALSIQNKALYDQIDFRLGQLRFISPYSFNLRNDARYQELLKLEEAMLNGVKETKKCLTKLARELEDPFFKYYSKLGQYVEKAYKDALNDIDNDRLAELRAELLVQTCVKNWVISRDDFDSLPKEAHEPLLELAQNTMGMVEKREALQQGKKIVGRTSECLSYHHYPDYSNYAFKENKSISKWGMGVGIALTICAVAAFSLATAGIGLAVLSSLGGLIAAGIGAGLGLTTASFSLRNYCKHARAESVMENALNNYKDNEVAFEQMQKERSKTNQNEASVSSTDAHYSSASASVSVEEVACGPRENSGCVDSSSQKESRNKLNLDVDFSGDGWPKDAFNFFGAASIFSPTRSHLLDASPLSPRAL